MYERIDSQNAVAQLSQVNDSIQEKFMNALNQSQHPPAGGGAGEAGSSRTRNEDGGVVLNQEIGGGQGPYTGNQEGVVPLTEAQ